ncbi:hypothetical protein RBSH_02874 [Rhodopirellula baltica SH28]|uniref:Uncharacterized protein n=1 Tax=Rhodopirellula baltica SH28 TaxID=993517 RepID=K5D567_RHOBT|nr:hypothetical protein RBSH_02874 [Rhodopirellula baltica SH28]
MRARENASGRGRTEGFHGRSSCRRDGEGWGRGRKPRRRAIARRSPYINRLPGRSPTNAEKIFDSLSPTPNRRETVPIDPATPWLSPHPHWLVSELTLVRSPPLDRG